MNSPKVACPRCGSTNIHLAGVSVNQNGVVTTVERSGVKIDPCQAPSGRGSEATISYWCESGHRFEHRFSFHKGAVAKAEQFIGNIDMNAKCDELWRE